MNNGNHRKFNQGFLTIPALRRVEAMKYSGSSDDEYWTLLEYYSETEFGIDFILDRSTAKTRREAEKLHLYFRSYIRQAKN